MCGQCNKVQYKNVVLVDSRVWILCEGTWDKSNNDWYLLRTSYGSRSPQGSADAYLRPWRRRDPSEEGGWGMGRYFWVEVEGDGGEKVRKLKEITSVFFVKLGWITTQGDGGGWGGRAGAWDLRRGAPAWRSLVHCGRFLVHSGRPLGRCGRFSMHCVRPLVPSGRPLVQCERSCVGSGGSGFHRLVSIFRVSGSAAPA